MDQPLARYPLAYLRENGPYPVKPGAAARGATGGWAGGRSEVVNTIAPVGRQGWPRSDGQAGSGVGTVRPESTGSATEDAATPPVPMW